MYYFCFYHLLLVLVTILYVYFAPLKKPNTVCIKCAMHFIIIYRSDSECGVNGECVA